MNDFLVLIQARTGSTRLPGKVLLPLLGKSVLERMWARVTSAQVPAQFAIITTTESNDDPIEELCQELQAPCFRGSTGDVLDRHYQAWKRWGGSAIVKIPSDCPLIDPQIIERVLNYYSQNMERFDFVSNLHPQSYPDGNDVEVMSASALSETWRNASQAAEREHTTPYIWTHPDRFRIGNVVAENSMGIRTDRSLTHRWTLDYAEDYKLIRRVFESLFPRKPLFTVDDIVNLLETHPELKEINKQHLGYVWYQKPAEAKRETPCH